MTPPSFLADENVPLASVRFLSRSGFKIVAVADVVSGVTDEDVLAFAAQNGQIVISFDKHFGRLVFLEKRVPVGVILLRVSPKSPEYISEVLLKLLGSEIALAGRFTVVTEDRVRSVPLPAR